jgi:hypothetical protein
LDILFTTKYFVNRLPCFRALPRGNWTPFEHIDSKGRTSVEWINGKITQDWKYITFQYQQRVFLGNVAQSITVAALLTNALTIEQGNQTALFFQDPENPLLLEFPTLEQYFTSSY